MKNPSSLGNILPVVACLAVAVATGAGVEKETHAMKTRLPDPVFPGSDWTRGDPERFGIGCDLLAKLDALMKEAQANGVLVRNGYVVAEWTYACPPGEKIMVQSCTKSITSLVLGLALQDGLIPSLDAKVKDYWPGFETGPYTGEITFRHLVTMTSGMATVRNWGLEYVNPGNKEPGTAYHYHNDQPVTLARALTYVFGRPLEDVLREKVLVPLRADMSWGQDGEIETPRGRVTVNHGLGYSHWTARDLARIGHLYLMQGRWAGRQILPESYVRESFTDIPFPITPWRAGKWMERQPQTQEGLSTMGYGLGWWTARQTPLKAWWMGGHGGQFCLVLPEMGIVMTKVNDWRKHPFVGTVRFLNLFETLWETEQQAARGSSAP